jgi:hypothetical protein
MLLNIECVFCFSQKPLSATFFILSLTERYHKRILVFMQSKFLDFLKKYSDIKLHENPSSESRAVPSGQTGGRSDRHDETNDLF